MKQISVYVFLFFVSIMTCMAQQEAMFSHYMYNTLTVNPAYAGSRDALTITALHRSQWVSFPGAPITQTITLHSPFYRDAVNLGLSVFNDNIGPVNNTSINLDYAYRVKVSDQGKLAFGLKMGINAFAIDLSGLRTLDNSDEFTQTSDNTILPNIGFGVYYSTPKFYAGISTPKLIQNQYEYNQIGSNLSKEQLHFYFIAGGLIKLSDDWDVKPTGFIKLTKAATIELDATAELFYLDRFSIGFMGRTGDAVGLLAGVGITEQLMLGYSFDWSFVNNTAKYNYGSHELLLRYDFEFESRKRIRSPRYFSTF